MVERFKRMESASRAVEPYHRKNGRAGYAS
jgi:hypothetical protein